MRKMILVGAMTIGLASVAYAGFKTSAAVTITKAADGSGNFFGNLHAARNSADDTKSRLYCRIQLNPFEPPVAVCGATNKAGVTLTCSTGNATFIEVIKAMTVNSHLNVAVSASGHCDHIFLRNDSAYPGI